MFRTRAHQGFTLIETLTFLIILAAATVATLGVAGPTLAGQTRVQAITSVRNTIARTRLLALTPHPNTQGAELRLGETLIGARIRIGAQASRTRTPDVTIQTPLPDGWSAVREDDQRSNAAPKGAISFAADGFSEDAVVLLTGPKQASARLLLLGISGQLFEANTEIAP